MNDNITQPIRASYDRLADEYARRIFNELQHKPLDRDLLDRFAADIAGRGDVCHMGCGPGHVARYLRNAGTTVFGLDSPGMLEQARQLNPDIPFWEGNMLALDLQDGALAGIAAFYAIVNIPKESLPLVFREMERVLQPGGLLLLTFHTGDEVLHEVELWGRPISMDFFLFGYRLSAGTSRSQGLKFKKSSSESLMCRKWSIRAGGRTFLPGSHGHWQTHWQTVHDERLERDVVLRVCRLELFILPTS